MNKLNCKKCNKEVEYSTQEVIFKNGTKHLEARCAECKTYLKYLPQNNPITILPYGKHKGKSLEEICEIDIEYLRWLYDETDKENLKESIDNAIIKFYDTN